jgi:hypothetical protein
MTRLGNGGICTQIGKYSDAMLNTTERKNNVSTIQISMRRNEKVIVRLSRRQN